MVNTNTRNNAAYKRMFEKITSLANAVCQNVYTERGLQNFSPAKFYFFELWPSSKRICVLSHSCDCEITFWKSARNKVPLHNVKVSISKNERIKYTVV